MLVQCWASVADDGLTLVQCIVLPENPIYFRNILLSFFKPKFSLADLKQRLLIYRRNRIIRLLDLLFICVDTYVINVLYRSPMTTCNKEAKLSLYI